MRCSVLSDAAYKGDIEQDRISTTVANGLRGTLVPLPGGYKVYNPAGWISKVTQIEWVLSFPVCVIYVLIL